MSFTRRPTVAGGMLSATAMWDGGTSSSSIARICASCAVEQPRRILHVAGFDGLEQAAAAVDAADRLNQVERRGVLVEQAVGAGDARRDAQSLVGVRGVDEHPRRREQALDEATGAQAGDLRRVAVEQHDVRPGAP